MLHVMRYVFSPLEQPQWTNLCAFVCQKDFSDDADIFAKWYLFFIVAGGEESSKSLKSDNEALCTWACADLSSSL